MIVVYYLLISIFTQLSPYGLTDAPQDTPGISHVSAGAAEATEAAVGGHTDVDHTDVKQVLVDFPVISGLKPGSPVLVQGNQVGRVMKISSKIDTKRTRAEVAAFEVAIELDSSIFEKLSKDTCALQSMPMTDGKKVMAPVVELFIPTSFSKHEKVAVLNPGDRIPGFASYEEFWRSGTDTRVRRKVAKAG